MDIRVVFKSIFGENKLSLEDFAAAVEKNTDLKLENLKEGNYVSKDKYTALETEVDNYKSQLDGVTKQLDKLKDSTGNIDELKSEIEKLKTDNQGKVKEYEDKIKDLQLTSAIKIAIGDKAYDADMVAGLVDKSLLKVDGDKVIGLDEQIKNIKETKGFLFKVTDPKQNYNPNKGSGAVTVNPWAKDTFNLTKQGEIYKENPAKAKEMMAAAGVAMEGV